MCSHCLSDTLRRFGYYLVFIQLPARPTTPGKTYLEAWLRCTNTFTSESGLSEAHWVSLHCMLIDLFF